VVLLYHFPAENKVETNKSKYNSLGTVSPGGQKQSVKWGCGFFSPAEVADVLIAARNLELFRTGV
jgi:hypothetical protein